MIQDDPPNRHEIPRCPEAPVRIRSPDQNRHLGPESPPDRALQGRTLIREYRLLQRKESRAVRRNPARLLRTGQIPQTKDRTRTVQFCEIRCPFGPPVLRLTVAAGVRSG